MKKLIFLLSVFMTLLLSSCKKENSFEGPEMVEIPGLEISMLNTEVTQALYESVMGENPSSNKGDNNPVEMVSWYDAVYFCNKLSEKYGYTPVYSVKENTDSASWGYTPHTKDLPDWYVDQNLYADGFRLPTVEEWLYAAKGGEDYTFSGSNTLKEVGWYEANSRNKTHPVAKKKINGYGLYDMCGNVNEWCWNFLNKGIGLDGRYFYGGAYWASEDEVFQDRALSGWMRDSSIGFRIVCSTTPHQVIDRIVLKSSELKEKMVSVPGKEYKILATEVTQSLYKEIMRENPSENKKDNNPVENVSWFDAVYFCNKLSEKLGYTPVYSVNGNTNTAKWRYTPNKGDWLDGVITQNLDASGFRLPTEKEWEYAARGGQNYKYSGSNNLDLVGWYDINSVSTTHSVAFKKANGYELYDMSGNVMEWCWDDGGHRQARCYRGGGSDGEEQFSEVSYKNYLAADRQYNFLGFRIVCSTSN